MKEKVCCQSCGITLEPGYYGTNADSTVSLEYCKYCYENGNFREPNITLDEMMGRAVAKMIDESQMTEFEAKKAATNTIPSLKRWSNVSN